MRYKKTDSERSFSANSIAVENRINLQSAKQPLKGPPLCDLTPVLLYLKHYKVETLNTVLGVGTLSSSVPLIPSGVQA